MRTVPSVLTCCAWMMETSGVSAGRSTTSSSSCAEGVVDDDDLLAGMPCSQRSSGGKPWLRDHVGAQPRLAGDERDVQRAGEEAQAHQVVGVVLHLHLAAFHGLAEADAGGGEAAVAAVGDLEAAHAAGADEDVERLAVGVRHQVQVLDAAARDLVDDGHRIAVDGEAAHGDLAPSWTNRSTASPTVISLPSTSDDELTFGPPSCRPPLARGSGRAAGQRRRKPPDSRERLELGARGRHRPAGATARSKATDAAAPSYRAARRRKRAAAAERREQARCGAG